MKQRFSKSILALGIAASGVLFLSTADSFAGAKELAAVAAQFPPGVTIDNATAQQWADAVNAAIPANKKLKPGVMAGEALKASNDPATGSVLGASLVNNGSLTSKITTIAADASITTSTGSGADASLVTDFIESIVSDDQGAFSIAALAIKKSKTAAGAVIGGRAQEVGDDTAILALANSSIQGSNKKLASAAQSIAQYVGDSVTPAGLVNFATSFAGSNLKSLALIAPGTVASDPSQASAILNGLYTVGSTTAQTVKDTSKLAKSIALVAATEQVQQVAVVIGDRIGTGAVKISNVNAIAKSLVSGLVKNPYNDPVADIRNNRLDEIGEVGAYLMNSIAANGDFDKIVKKKAKAASIITGLLKSLISVAKVKGDLPYQQTAAVDIAGSVAQTIRQLGTSQYTSDILAQITSVLSSAKTATKILGGKLANQKVNGVKLGTLVNQALVDGLNNTNNADQRFEDGTQPTLGTINEPVTDNRNG